MSSEIRSDEGVAQESASSLESSVGDYGSLTFAACSGCASTIPARAHDSSAAALSAAASAYVDAVSRDAAAIRSMAASFAEDDRALADMMATGMGGAA